MIKKVYLAHPFLFAILPAIFLWEQNFGEVSLREVLLPLFTLLVFGGFVWGVLWILFRNLEKSAIISSIILIITLSFGYIYNIFFYNSFIQVRFLWTFLILFLIFATLLFLIKNTKKDLLNVNKSLTIATGVFILISLFQVTLGYYNEYVHVQHDSTVVAINTNEEINKLRDIYYIILDGYSSPEVVRDVMGLEEEDDVVDFLEEKGFFIADKSRSNYPLTLWSLPSSLNMQHLEDPSADRRHFTMAEDHNVKDFLKSYGYKYIHLGDNAFTYFNRYADENINPGILSPYQSALWINTVFKPLQDMSGIRLGVLAYKLGFLESQLTDAEIIKFKLKKLSEIPNREGQPIFTFAHFLVLKDMDIFGKSLDGVNNDPVKNYLENILYINKEIEKLVDILLKNSDREPIIIIQGDHGFPFWLNQNLIEEFAQPDRAKKLIVPGKYSFPIFNAYYFPDGGDELLYNTISPVNTFRILFNYYFGQNFDLLDDVSYTNDLDDDSKFILWEKDL